MFAALKVPWQTAAKSAPAIEYRPIHRVVRSRCGSKPALGGSGMRESAMRLMR
jgi:hypothetical protein